MTTASALVARISQEGARQEAAGNQPILLEDPAWIWLVLEGQMDVFAVHVVDDHLQGARDYLYTVSAGDVLFGMEPDWADEVALLAVGNVGTSVCRMAVARFRQMVSEDPQGGSSLVDQYIQTVSSAVSDRVQPRFDILLAPGEDAEAKSGQAIAPRRGIVWITIETGVAFFDGREELPVGPADAPFPLGVGAWMMTANPTQVSVRETTAAIRSEAFWRGLDAFHRVALEWADIILKDDRERERAQVTERLESDVEASHRALGGLSTVMGSEADGRVDGEGGPLLHACRLIGQRLKVSFLPASPWEVGKGGLQELRGITRRSAIGYRRVALSEGWWVADGGPLLAFLAMDSDGEESPKRPVALLPTGTNSYDLVDPRDGKRTPVDGEVAASLEPFGYAFSPPLPAHEIGIRDLLGFITRGIGADLRTILLMGFLGAVLGLLTPILVGYLFDSVIPSANMGQLVTIFLALCAATITGVAFLITRSIAVIRLQSRVGPGLQMAVLDRLLRLPLPFFRQFSAGDLSLRAAGVTVIGRELGGATISSILGSIVSAGAFVLLFYYSPPLALLATAILSINVVFTVIIGRYALRFERRLQEVEGNLSGMVLQFLTGIAKLRVSGTEARAFARWAAGFKQQRELRFRVGRFANNVVVFNSVLSVVSILLIYWLYTELASNPDTALTTGNFLAFNAAFGTFMASGMSLTRTGMGLLRLVPTWERARPILTALPEVSPDRPDPGELKGRIEVSHLTFRYSHDGPLILNDLSFEAVPGQFIALVGPSGAGKSTLLKVLLGFEIPESNSVYYDGHDLSAIDITAVRRQIGVVLQSSKLTAGDVFANIVGSSAATMADAWDAARMAGMEADLKDMPMGMHTVISEGGGTLSGGQRQRLLIARALVTKPRLLFFDEATSALDNRTQQIVSESIERLHATRVVIAHRLSTIRFADRIYVLENGRCVESGTFDELMTNAGLFAKLAARQEA